MDNSNPFKRKKVINVKIRTFKYSERLDEPLNHNLTISFINIAPMLLTLNVSKINKKKGLKRGPNMYYFIFETKLYKEDCDKCKDHK